MRKPPAEQKQNVQLVKRFTRKLYDGCMFSEIKILVYKKT